MDRKLKMPTKRSYVGNDLGSKAARNYLSSMPKVELGSKEHIAGSAAAIGAGAYFVNKKPKPKSKGLKTPTAKSMKKIDSRLANTHRLYSAAANKVAMESGKTKPTLGYNPKTGTMTKEPRFDANRFNQINKSFMSGKPQTKSVPDVRSAQLGNRMRRVDAAMDKPKNKVIRTMGKILNVVRGASAIGALSYAASSTPVGDATMDGKKYKNYKMTLNK